MLYEGITKLSVFDVFVITYILFNPVGQVRSGRSVILLIVRFTR